MYATNAILAAFALYPVAVLSQVSLPPQQTIVPFSTLPQCAQNCGPLFDAQGACSPPVVATSSVLCFCQYGALQSLYTSTTGVCPNACPNDPNGLQAIQTWFKGLCSGASQPTPTTSAGSTPSLTSAGGGTSTDSSLPVNGGAGNSGSATPTNQSWTSTHWQWIIMIVVLTVGIIGCWIAACLLRRRYIRRKEREYELRPPAAPWVTGANHPGGNAGMPPYGDGVVPKGKARDSTMFAPRPGSAAARGPTTSVISEKPIEKKKWVVKERT